VQSPLWLGMEETNNKCRSEDDVVDVDVDNSDDVEDDADEGILNRRRVRTADRTLLPFVMNFLIRQ
jgi:hypothetical protein